jgi:hypothetical protein
MLFFMGTLDFVRLVAFDLAPPVRFADDLNLLLVDDLELVRLVAFFMIPPVLSGSSSTP